MLIYPAIDLRGGKAVRLCEGDYSRMKLYDDDPVAVAESFAAAGSKHLHVVDLDGAKDGQTPNFEVIARIVAQSGLFVEVGGGIRTEERIKRYLDAGVGRTILGTVAAENPEFVRQMVAKYGDKIAVSVDAKDQKVAIKGWQEVTQLDSVAYCQTLADMGVATIIYTDIAKDGMMSGTNLEIYALLQNKVPVQFIASGGITYESELAKLSAMGVYGAIIGKAIYEKELDLSRIINEEANRCR